MVYTALAQGIASKGADLAQHPVIGFKKIEVKKLKKKTVTKSHSLEVRLWEAGAVGIGALAIWLLATSSPGSSNYNPFEEVGSKGSGVSNVGAVGTVVPVIGGAQAVGWLPKF